MKTAKKSKKLEKYTRYSIFVIVLFSIIVLSLTSIYHVSGDGCWHIPAGKFIADNLKFPLFEPLGRDEPFWSPPLYHIFVAAVYYFFSFNGNVANFAAKFVSPVFGILSLIFSFLLIKKLANPKIAFYSTIFLAFIPIFIDYSVLSYTESVLVFFVVLSIYFLAEDKIILSGIAAGLSILAKYNGVLVLPILLYIAYKKYHNNKRFFYRNCAILVLATLVIASPWLIRNWALLGNPIWPFLNFIFHGFESKAYSQANFHNLIRLDLYESTYLGIFGVPDGNYAVFSFVKIQNLWILIVAWLIGTLVFIAPLIAGLLKFKKFKSIKSDRNNYAVTALKIWVLFYVLLFMLYVINVGTLVSRIILPAFPALAVFWAFGFEHLAANFSGTAKKILLALFLIAVIGLVASETIKVNIAANAWDKYKADFEWIKSNTDKKSVFIANGQCVPYNIERTSLYSTSENLDKADYIWVNQNLKLDSKSILDERALKSIQSKNYKIVYSNKETGTAIYGTKQQIFC